MERLKECKCRSENGNCTMIGGFCTSIPQNYCEMAKELKSLREKQTPMKVVYGDDNGKVRKCCNRCGSFPSPLAKYCKNCGQALSWP